MSRALLLQGKQAIQIDIIWLFWTVVAFLIFAYLQVYIDIEPEIAAKSTIGFSLLLGGTVMGAIIVGFKTDSFYSLDDFVNSLGFIFVGILSIYVVNIYTSTLQLSSIPISGTLFMMLMAVSEEALFRGFLCTMFTKMAGSSVIGVALSSVIGMAYHSAVYGASTTNMLIVFGSFCVLGFSYVLSGYRLSVPTTAHVIVNAIAGGAFG
jgi:membrane protease YdiL (CAAX protease family)